MEKLIELFRDAGCLNTFTSVNVKSYANARRSKKYDTADSCYYSLCGYLWCLCDNDMISEIERDAITDALIYFDEYCKL